MHSLPYRPTVAQYRAYLTTHGVTVPSRLRKEEVGDLALLIRFSTLTDVRRVLGNKPGVKLDEVALLAAWAHAESRPGMHPVDRGEVVPDAVPCDLVYPHMPHDDGTPIKCNLPTGHDGDHMDRSHVETTGEVMSWDVVTAPTVEVAEDDRPVLVSIALTPFQRSEVEHGLDVDYADDNGPVWGVVRRTGTTTSYLDVLDYNGAVYRLSSGRDILADNATSDFGPDASTRSAAAGARSLTSLLVKLVDAAGGPDSLDATTRRWVRPGDYTPVPVVEVETVAPNTKVTVERPDGPCPGWIMGTVTDTDTNGAVTVDYDNPVPYGDDVRVLVECDDNCYSHVITGWSRVTVGWSV